MLIVVIGGAIYIAVQPNSFKVTRSITIKAPAEVIYNNVIDFKNWPDWLSWLEENPETTVSFPEKTNGINGSYSWEDSKGKGSMTTLEASNFTSIKQEMRFGEYPPSMVDWKFTSTHNGATEVTWSISGENLPFDFKAFNIISGGIEKTIGPQYERSLAKLDSIVTASIKIYNITVNGTTNLSGGYYLYNTTSCKINEISNKIQELMPNLITYVKNNNIEIAGAPFINYIKWDIDNNAAIFSCCAPTSEKIITTNSNILTGQLPSFKAVKTTLTGNYINLTEAWDTAKKYVTDNTLEFTENGPMIEIYKTTPNETANPANWITEIYIAVKEE